MVWMGAEVLWFCLWFSLGSPACPCCIANRVVPYSALSYSLASLFSLSRIGEKKNQSKTPLYNKLVEIVLPEDILQKDLCGFILPIPMFYFFISNHSGSQSLWRLIKILFLPRATSWKLLALPTAAPRRKGWQIFTCSSFDSYHCFKNNVYCVF